MVEYTSQNLSAIFQSLADPTRRDIVQQVCQHQRTISELASKYQMSFAGVAKHIAVLEKSHIVTKHKKGKEQIIDVNPQSFSLAIQHLNQYTAILSQRYHKLEQLLQEDI
jgi:DNA-binding transcriptional ArsR family regulator